MPLLYASDRGNDTVVRLLGEREEMTCPKERFGAIRPPMTKPESPRYLMSFGTGGAHLNESIALAAVRLGGAPWDEVAQRLDLFAVRKEGSAKRLARELTHRLRRLKDEELALLCAGDRTEQKALLWLAICRTYQFIGEWAREVLVDRAQTYQLQISYPDFDRFWREKEEQAPDLATLTPSTRAKLRAVLFRLMRETDVSDDKGRLTGASAPSRVCDRLADGEQLFFGAR